MSKPHLVTFQLFTKRFDISEMSKLNETSKLWRFVLTNQNVPIFNTPPSFPSFPVLNLRSWLCSGLESSFLASFRSLIFIPVFVPVLNLRAFHFWSCPW